MKKKITYTNIISKNNYLYDMKNKKITINLILKRYFYDERLGFFNFLKLIKIRIN